MDSSHRPTLTLTGTWTVEPLVPVVEYWTDLLGLDLVPQLAPYAQLFQQLLDPGSAFRANGRGANAILLRWTDLLGGAAQQREVVERRVDEVARALTSFEHAVPCLVLLGPHAPDDALLQHADAELRSRLADTPNLWVEPGLEVMRRYEVRQSDDPVSDRFGHVPFTGAAIAALGTAIIRWYAALTRSPVKVVAVDGDHTLWSGVVGESGVAGIRVEPGHAALQRALLAQNEAGRLLCLLSKNEEADVREAFESGRGMLLRWPQLTARRVDWNPKPANLAQIASELELGLDSVVFLDDNPVECAQMRAHCPAVATVRVPDDPSRLASFVEHLWLFDVPRLTAEDRKRAGMYRENAARAQLRRGSESLQAFLDGLELVVGIEPPAASDLPRLAQLSQRTNQFNCSLLRCSEADIAGRPDDYRRAVRARDRFGDYGLVGQVRARVEGDCLVADLFMLSCRALGRGIEYRMLAALGAHALSLGLPEVSVQYREGERNLPARRFLEAAFGAAPRGDGSAPRISAATAAQLRFDAERMSGPEPSPAAVAERQPASAASATPRSDDGSLYERIAHALNTGERIERAIAQRLRPRPEVSAGFVAPAPGREREIAAIWQEVLRIEPIGAHDRFSDLGGKSIHLVRVHGLLLERLGVDLDIVDLFQHPTVSALAAHIDARACAGTLDAARQRGQKMREARARSARRHGAIA